MRLSFSEVEELAKLSKKCYKFLCKYSDHMDDDYFQDSDEAWDAWDDEAYRLEKKRDNAQEKLEKLLKELFDKHKGSL